MIDPTTLYYKQCFATESGKLVLANMLDEAGFFKHLHTPEDIAKENFMKTVLQKTGCYGKENALTIAESIMNMPTIRSE